MLLMISYNGQMKSSIKAISLFPRSLKIKFAAMVQIRAVFKLFQFDDSCNEITHSTDSQKCCEWNMTFYTSCQTWRDFFLYSYAFHV